MAERIPAYFSHSYRHQDRAVNRYFWHLLWSSGFTLTVDPESESLSIPYLEHMMKHSTAFVAVVTHRPEQDTYQCSPFMIFEYGLAVRAQKPKLVFVEAGVSKYFFPDSAEVSYFSRQNLGQIRAEAENRLRLLARRSDAVATTLGRGLGKVGVLIGAAGDDREPAVQALIRRLGYTPVALDTQVADSFRLSLQLDELDFIVLDLDSPRLPPWLLPFVNGRFVPSILVRDISAAGTQLAGSPASETDKLLESVTKSDELYVHYRTTAKLTHSLSRHIERLRREQILFTSLRDGNRYFQSLGRSRDRVFISNASDANDRGRALSAALGRENIPHFHYRYQSDIELANLWASELPERVRASQYFLPLITAQYWDSKYCVDEYALARELAKDGRIKIVPYFLEASSADIPQQGRDVSELPPARQAKQIAADLDRLLTAAEQERNVR